LQVVVALIGVAAAVGALQVGALVLGRLAASVNNVTYVSVSMLAYVAALASAARGRRQGFFWNALAVALLHLVFVGWYLLSTIRLLIDLQVSPFPLGRFEQWNLGVFALALSLAVYLLVIERRRLFVLRTVDR
jgi:hypothetical protein